MGFFYGPGSGHFVCEHRCKCGGRNITSTDIIFIFMGSGPALSIAIIENVDFVQFATERGDGSTNILRLLTI